MLLVLPLASQKSEILLSTTSGDFEQGIFPVQEPTDSTRKTALGDPAER
ncbi:MAG: hypothetical protein AB1861_24285 [Cyanobacteriota bacterium]